MYGLLLAVSLSLATIDSQVNRRSVDRYAECGYWYWNSIAIARQQGDLDLVSELLGSLNELAEEIARTSKVSKDSAHAILRRSGEKIGALDGADIIAISIARERCRRQGDLFDAPSKLPT